jgi:hypothetical protein
MFLFRIRFNGETSSFTIKNMSLNGKAIRYSRDFSLSHSDQIEKVISEILREIYTDATSFYVSYTAIDSQYSYYVGKPLI